MLTSFCAHRDGSKFVANPDGSKFYDKGNGFSKFTPAPASEDQPADASKGASGQERK